MTSFAQSVVNHRIDSVERSCLWEKQNGFYWDNYFCNGADSYVFSKGSVIDKYLGVDGGTITFDGGECNSGMMVNNGGEDDINFTITGNSCFSNMSVDRFVIYAPEYSETSIHLILSGGYDDDDDPRLFYMQEDEKTGELQYKYLKVSTYLPGYTYHQYNDGVYIKIADVDITEDNLEKK